MIDPCTHFDSTGRCEIHPKAACPGHCASYDDGQHLEFMSVAQMFARIKMWQEVTDGEDPFLRQGAPTSPDATRSGGDNNQGGQAREN